MESLDKPLIESLLNESQSIERNQKLIEIAGKYGFQFKSSTAVYEVEDYLRNLIKDLDVILLPEEKVVKLNKLLEFKLNVNTHT